MNKHFAIAYIALASLLPELGIAAKAENVAPKAEYSAQSLAGTWFVQSPRFLSFGAYERRIDIFTDKDSKLAVRSSLHAYDKVAHKVTKDHGTFIKCADLVPVQFNSKETGKPVRGFQATSGVGQIELTLLFEPLTPDKVRVTYSDAGRTLLSRTYTRRKVHSKAKFFTEEALLGSWKKQQRFSEQVPLTAAQAIARSVSTVLCSPYTPVSTSVFLPRYYYYEPDTTSVTRYYNYVLQFAIDPTSNLLGVSFDLSSSDARLQAAPSAKAMKKAVCGGVTSIATRLGDEVVDQCFFITNTLYIKFLDRNSIELLSTECSKLVLHGLPFECSILGKYLKV